MFRKNDYKKSSEKPLTKNATSLKPAEGEVIGSANRVIIKQSIKKGTLFYKSFHNIAEYFACEITQYLGIITPKCRRDHQAPLVNYSSGITGYIPLLPIRHHVPIDILFPDTKEKCLQIRKHYKLDEKNQVLVDLLDNNKTYKVSGHLYATNIAAALVLDNDYSPIYLNTGFVKVGERFYAVMIDKELANFTKSAYFAVEDFILPGGKCYNELYDHCSFDQAASFIENIKKGLLVTNGQCDFERIFLNPRVMHTDTLKDNAAEFCQVFLKRAKDIVKYYDADSGKYQLFLQREKLRKQIAEKVLDSYQLLDEEKQALTSLIIQDLRAPYYEHLYYHKNKLTRADLYNDKLIATITSDIQAERNLTQHVQVPKC